MDIKLSETPKVKAMSVEATPAASNESKQSAHGNEIHFDLESGAHSDEEPEAEVGCLPDNVVNSLLPEVPPGNLEQKQFGIPKRFAHLIIYFGLLIYTTVSGWLAFKQYRTTVSTCGYFGPPYDYIWLASLLLLAVHNVIGPLPRALADLLGVRPGGLYRYELKQNDVLNPGFPRTSMLILTTLSTFIQFGVFYLSFFSQVVEEGVKVPAAIVAIVPALISLGGTVGINSAPGRTGGSEQAGDMLSLLREGLYSDPNEGGSKRRLARQKLAGRILVAKLILWVMFGGFLAIVYVSSSSFGVGWRNTKSEVSGNSPPSC